MLGLSTILRARHKGTNECASLNDFTLEYLSSLFDYRESLDDFRESEMKLAMPRPRTNYMKTSFIYIATESLE